MEKIDVELSVASPPAEEKNLAIHNDHAGSKGSLISENASVGKHGRRTIICTAGDRAVQFVGGVSSAILQAMLKDKSL